MCALALLIFGEPNQMGQFLKGGPVILDGNVIMCVLRNVAQKWLRKRAGRTILLEGILERIVKGVLES